ncbi:hypothetical protein OUZ56_000367 [Daphnia magna]|uniref:Uncharacterized protein n=1 Tax=Daphnia magna TaxID=35525 RepID=A0ABQ9ZZG7_9CRUS|nr:hypothetical protein OUZ56_000367 [Daphnia magna]
MSLCLDEWTIFRTWEVAVRMTKVCVRGGCQFVTDKDRLKDSGGYQRNNREQDGRVGHVAFQVKLTKRTRENENRIDICPLDRLFSLVTHVPRLSRIIIRFELRQRRQIDAQ